MYSLGVGSVLYKLLGERSVCEHWGKYKSNELSRFRHSKHKFRICPMCGLGNSISEPHCGNTIILVEYLHIDPPVVIPPPPPPPPPTVIEGEGE